MTGVLIKRGKFGERDRYAHRENSMNMKTETGVAIVWIVFSLCCNIKALTPWIREIESERRQLRYTEVIRVAISFAGTGVLVRTDTRVLSLFLLHRVRTRGIWQSTSREESSHQKQNWRTYSSWTSILQNRKTIHFCYLCYPVCGALSQQPCKN